MKTGCPVVFIYRFIIYAELLAIKIRANNINAFNNLKKISLLADDIPLILDDFERLLMQTLDT